MSTEPTSVQQNHDRQDTAVGGLNARVLHWVFWVIIGVIVGFGVYKATQIGMRTWAAYASVRALHTLATSGDPLAQIEEIGAEVGELNQAVTALNRDVAPFMPVLAGLKRLPVYGPTLATVPELAAGGGHLLDLGDQAMAITAPVFAQTEGDLVTRAIETVRQTGGELADLAPLAENAAAEFADLDAAGVDPRIANELVLAKDAAPVLPAMLRLSPQLPALLGFDSPKTYLLLVQNNHELRATGGFITAVARVTLDQGRVTDLEVVDSYQIFRRASAYPPAPEPMQRFMGIPLMLLRDANWSPDLPTTAALVQALYQQDTGVHVDGVVTADLHALELLVEGLGSIQMEGLEQPVTRENALELIKQFWQNPEGEGGVSGGSTAENREEFNEWWQQRKDFMPALAGAVLQRVQSGDLEPVAFLRAGITALNERAVQATLKDPEAAEVFAELGWDGSIEPVDAADYLALIDTNMGYNKVDSVLERRLDYRVDWPSDGSQATATVTVTYRHPMDVAEHTCDLTPRYGADYDDMAARCYFDYVRLYVPEGSTLVELTGVEPDSVSSRPGEHDTQVFAGYFVLKPGEEHTVTFEYRLPESITADGYSLVIQRQAGSGPLPLSIHVGDAEQLDVVLTSGRLEWTP